MENPFADYGSIVHGSRFIGRENEIQAVQNRVFGKAYGNLAIQGLPRIGKSSLAWKSIFECQDELKKMQIIPIRINSGSFESSKLFFEGLIFELFRQIKKNQILQKVELFYDIFEKFQEAKRQNDKNNFFEEFLEILKEQNHRVIYVLDEFDAVRNYFSIGDFQFLRELSYNPETKICIVTVSRRSLKDIEPEGGTISNFYQTFKDIYLGMFSDEDLNLYWNKFFDKCVPISDEGKRKIYEVAGHHPFLLDLFNYHLYNNLSHNINQSIIKTREILRLTILNNYKTILDLLSEENLTTKLLQMVVGPVYDITVTEAEKIERYNLVTKFENSYRSFSNDFHNYLFLAKREIPIWNLWTETEIKLRNIVQIWLYEKYGDNWVSKFRNIQGMEAYIANLEMIQEKEKNSFPDTYSRNLLDFTYPSDLFDKFMRVEWKWFRFIFGNDANYWKQKFDVLAKVRNPLAHNKENILKDFQRDEAKAYCNEIIEKVNTWIQDNDIVIGKY